MELKRIKKEEKKELGKESNKANKAKETREMQLEEPKIRILKASEKGLDYLHYSMLFLIALLIGLVVFFSSSQKIYLATTPIHTEEEIKNYTNTIAGSFYYSNYSFIPFSLNLPSARFENGLWLVEYNVSSTKNKLVVLINDSNMAVEYILYSAPIQQPKITGLKLVGNGVIETQYPKCNMTYWFIDPYALNALSTLNYSRGNEKFIFLITNDAIEKYATYGGNSTLNLIFYLRCAYRQGKLKEFVENFKTLGISTGPKVLPVQKEALNQIAMLTGLNKTKMDECLSTSMQGINAEALLANFYNITFTPIVLVNCRYMTSPQHISDALNYAKSR